MIKPVWHKTKIKEGESKILYVYTMPSKEEAIVFFYNLKSKLSRQDQVKHLTRSLSITEKVWQEVLKGSIDVSDHKIKYEDEYGNPSPREEVLADVIARIRAAGHDVDYKNFAAELLKGDGYDSYIPIVKRCGMKDGKDKLII